MSPDGVMSENEKKVRFLKFIQKRRIKGEPIPKSYLGDEDDSKIQPEVGTAQEHLVGPYQKGNVKKTS